MRHSLLTLLRSRRGETMVEVMVSMVLFLMLFAVMLGAVQFASNAQVRAEAIRRDATELQRDLRSKTPSGGTARTYQFYAVTEDGATVGRQVFDVPLLEQSVTAGTDDGSKSVTFYLYGPETGGTGGGG